MFHVRIEAFSDPFIAEVMIFAGNFAPRNWAFCNGQLLPISQNTALFSLIGTTYGGDGRTTTALPNMQGRAPMHPGRGPGLSQRRLGENGGFETVTLTENQLPGHSHNLKASAFPANDDDPAGQYLLTVGMQGHGPGEFWLPAGLFIDKQDRLYIADAYNRRVQVFRYIGGAE